METRSWARSVITRCVGRRDLRPPEVPDRGVAVGTDHDGVAVDRAVRDPEFAEPDDVLPHVRQDVVGDLPGPERPQRPPADLGHEHRVTPVGHPGGDDRQHRDAAPFRHQGQERLVLDLLEPPGADVRRLASMPDRRPGRRQQLPVACVAPVDLHLEGATVRIRRRREPGPARLERRVPQVRRLDVEVREGERDLIQREPSGRRAERQVHDRGGTQPDQGAGDHADRERDPEGDPRHRAGQHDPSPDEPQRAAHVRRGHHHDRRRDGQAHGEVDGRRLRRADGAAGWWPDPFRRPARRASRTRTRAAPASSSCSEQPFAAVRDQREEQEHEPPTRSTGCTRSARTSRRDRGAA